MKHMLSLFAGGGAFDLGLESTGEFQTVAMVENADYPSEVLKLRFPEVQHFDDVCDFDGTPFRGEVDGICGGFPCQDISLAGLGAGLAGERSGLWFEYLRLIGELRPEFVVVENVKALLTRGLDVVLGGLASLRYDAEWDCIPASYVGAPHDRDRIWIVAYPERGERRQEPYSRALGRMGRKQQSVPWDRPWQDSLRELRRMDDGSAYRVHRVDTIRNAVVPQIPEAIGRAIMSVHHD